MPMITISATTTTITILKVILAACGLPPPNSFEAQVLQSVRCILFQNNCIPCLNKLRRKETRLEQTFLWLQMHVVCSRLVAQISNFQAAYSEKLEA
ncbi:hypothetical protein ACB098_12G010600 [Castanea mollissima]